MKKINWFIHDTYFTLEELEWQRRERIVSIPLRGENARASRLGVLVVADVADLSVEDDSGVGEYDIFEISYEGGELVIRGNVPITVRMRVGRIDIALRGPPGH